MGWSPMAELSMTKAVHDGGGGVEYLNQNHRNHRKDHWGRLKASGRAGDGSLMHTGVMLHPRAM